MSEQTKTDTLRREGREQAEKRLQDALELVEGREVRAGQDREAGEAKDGAIAETEQRLLDAETARANFQAHLTTVEEQLLLSGVVDGKNAEQRAAQLRASTAASRAQVNDAAATVARLKVSLHQQQNEFAAGRAIARVLSATDN